MSEDHTQFFSQPPPPPAPPRPSWGRRVLRFVGRLLLFLVLIGLVVGSGTAVWLWLQIEQTQTLLPGTAVLDIPLGGLTPAEAETKLARDWAARTIMTEGTNMTLRVTPTELGISLDVPATIAQARAQSEMTGWADIPRLWQTGQSVNPVWSYNPATAEVWLQSVAPYFYVIPVEARVLFRQGEFVSTAAQVGQELDIPETMAWLNENANTAVFYAEMPLLITPLTPTITDASALAEELNQRLIASLTLPLFDPVRNETATWTVPAETWTAWLMIPTSDNNTPNWGVDGGQVQRFIWTQTAELGETRYIDENEAVQILQTAVLSQLNDEPVNLPTLRIYHHPQTHTVQAGETLSSIGRAYGFPYPWLQAANPNLTNLALGQTITIPSPDTLLPLDPLQNKRIIVSLSQQKMWAYENGQPKWEWPVSTGQPDSPTSPGIFQVQSHEPNAYASIWDLWMPNFMGIYRPVPSSDFMNGFHGFPTRQGSQLLWTNSLGTPVTYGCILVHDNNMALLYEWAEAGTIVEVVP